MNDDLRMELHFQVLVSSNIRRKKPWSRLEWIGKQKESVFLLDRNRTSILYLPSGNTKRVISAIKPYAKELLCLNTSSSGEYVVGLLASGKIVRWFKDTNTVSLIPAYPGFALAGGKGAARVHLFISNDGKRIVLIINLQSITVWEEIPGSSTLTDEFGEWSSVNLGSNLLKVVTAKETSVDAMFYTDQIQGRCCMCTFVLNNANDLNVCCLLLQWRDDEGPQANLAKFTSSMTSCSFPLDQLNPPCQSLRKQGSYITRLSHDARMLAIAINQRQPSQSHVFFVNVHTQVGISSNHGQLFMQKVKTLPQFARTYWISKMSWTCDDLFLACITRRGSLLLFSGAGEPIMIASHGLRMELGPSFLLPLHPLVEPKIDKKFRSGRGQEPPSHNRPQSPMSIASSLTSVTSLKQKFSVTTHPRLPIILCSDGYTVTALQLTHFVTSYDVATLSLIEANQKLKVLTDKFNLQISGVSTPRHEQRLAIEKEVVFKENKYTRLYMIIKDKFKRSKTKEKPSDEAHRQIVDESLTNDMVIDNLAYQFEKMDKEVSTENEESFNQDEVRQPPGAILGADEGKITFGDLGLTLDSTTIEESINHRNVDGESLSSELGLCAKKVLLGWGLISSHNSILSTATKLNEAKQIQDRLHLYYLDTLQTLCDVIIAAQQVSLCIPWNLNDNSHDASASFEGDYRGMFRNILQTLISNVVMVAAWNPRSLHLVRKSLEIGISSVLKQCTHAPEGCTTVQDIEENVVTSLALLLQAQDVLQKCNRYDKAQYLPSKDNSPGTQVNSLLFPSIWRKFWSYFTLIFSTPAIESRPAVVKVLRLLEVMLHHTASHDSELKGRALYTLSSMTSNLMDYKIDLAIKLASSILNDHLKVGSKWNSNAWKAVELLCSVMSSYFSDKPLTFHVSSASSNRITSINRDVLTSLISSRQLSDVWNADHAVVLMLRCGRLFEACDLANNIGAWKAAVCIGAVADKVRAFSNNQKYRDHQNLVFKVMKTRFKSFLPRFCFSNETEEIDETEDLFEFRPELLLTSFADLFTVGVMTGYDVATWAASKMLGGLKKKCRNYGLLVDDDIHLPEPPVYLPQPTPDVDEGNFPQVILRHQVSAFTRSLLIIFEAVGMLQNLCIWHLETLQSDADEISTSLTESLSKSQCGFDKKFLLTHGSVLCAIFREICALLWLLHAREKLSAAVREYQFQRERGEDLSDVIDTCLQWTKRLNPFSKYMGWGAQLDSLILCLSFERKVDFHLVSTLAENFCDPDKINPKVKTRLDLMQQRLREYSVPVKGKSSQFETDQESDVATKPMSVYYQRMCSRILQNKKHDSNEQDVFAEFIKAEQAGKARSFETCFTPLSTSFPFDTDEAYHNFLSQFFHVIVGKASSDRKQSSSKLLLLGNRLDVALLELSVAMEHASHNKLSSKMHNQSFVQTQPDSSSTPKASLRKAKSFHAIPTSHHRQVSIIESGCTDDARDDIGLPQQLRRYFSQSHLDPLSPDEAADWANRSLNDDFRFEINDAPLGMRKRLHRLLPYTTWLQYWMQRDASTKEVDLKPSIRLQFTRNHLLQSLFVAEARFGREANIAFEAKPRPFATDQEASKTESPAPSSKAPLVTGENNERREEEIQPTDQSEISTDQNVTILDGATAEVDEEERRVEETDGIEDPSKDSAESHPDPDLEEPISEKDVTLELEDLHPEENCSEYADGGNTVRQHSMKPIQQTSSDGNVADVVRSEIHNVLLAQQVSLLSQILLQQTLTGNPLASANQTSNNVASVLNSLIPGFPLNQPTTTSAPTQSNAPPAKVPQQSTSNLQSERTEPPTETLSPPIDDLTASPKRSLFRRSAPNNNNNFSIPLFHVPGITKSQEPKNINLIKTPKSNRGWKASFAARDNYSGSHPSSPPRLLKTSHRSGKETRAFHGQPSVSYRNILPSKVENRKNESRLLPAQLDPSVALKSAPIQSRPKFHEAGVYQTDFPILSSPSNTAPSKPTFYERPRPVQPLPVQRMFTHIQSSSLAPPTMLEQPQRARQIVPSLIDPREVLTYHRQKQTFSSVKKPTFQKVRPPPMLSLAKPGLIIREPPPSVAKQPPASASEKTQPSQPVEVPSPVKKTVITEKKPKTPPPPSEFDGLLNQEDVNREVAQLADQVAQSDEKLSQADIHFMATAVKKIPNKPRMVNAQSQAEISPPQPTSDEDEDYRDKLTTKPLPPPPEIFSRIREEGLNVLSGETSGDQRPVQGRSDFLHMGDVSLERVARGMPHKPQTVAEAHYKSAHLLPSGSDVTGFPQDIADDKVSQKTLSEHIEDANRVRNIREDTRDRWMGAMKNMSAQLNAMEVMARRMDDDFKASNRLLDVIDAVEEVAVPSIHNSRRSPVDERQVVIPPSVSFRTPVMDPPRPQRYSPDRTFTLPPPHLDSHLLPPRVFDTAHLPKPRSSLQDSAEYKARLKEAYKMVTAHEGPSPMFAEDSLHSTDYDVSMASRDDKSESYHEELPHDDADSSDLGSDVMESLLEDYTEIDQDAQSRRRTEPKHLPDRKNKKKEASMKPWNMRSEKEKNKIRAWMKVKKREQAVKFREEVKRKHEEESNPYRPSEGKKPISNRALMASREQRESHQREMLTSHMSARLDQSVKLMGDLQKRPHQKKIHKKSSNDTYQRRPLKETNGRRMGFAPKDRNPPYTKQRKSRNFEDDEINLSGSHGNLSDVSILSSWTLSDEVKRALYGSVKNPPLPPNKTQVTFDLGDQEVSSFKDDLSVTSGVDADSKETESLLADVDWTDVDALVATVDDK